MWDIITTLFMVYAHVQVQVQYTCNVMLIILYNLIIINIHDIIILLLLYITCAELHLIQLIVTITGFVQLVHVHVHFIFFETSFNETNFCLTFRLVCSNLHQKQVYTQSLV